MRQKAEVHITELEQQLQTLNHTLMQERTRTTAAREEHKRIVEQLQLDNAQLQRNLEGVSLQLCNKFLLIG